MGTLDQVTKLQEIFGGGPLAAFLGVSLLAGALMSALYIREVRAHRETLREMLPLVASISTTWEHHLDQVDELKDDLRLAREELRTAVAIINALRPKLTPDGTPRFGG